MTYRKWYSQEGYGSMGEYGIEINIALNREPTEEDSLLMNQVADTIKEGIFKTSMAQDVDAKSKRVLERVKILNLFPLPIYVEEIPNGYCGSWCCSQRPWFIVTTTIGRIKIGWRKRVMHIEWTDTVVKGTAEELFPDENVTRYDKVIHAWSMDAARKYIDTIMRAA